MSYAASTFYFAAVLIGSLTLLLILLRREWESIASALRLDPSRAFPSSTLSLGEATRHGFAGSLRSKHRAAIIPGTL